MTTKWRIQWGRSIEGPDGGIDRCAPVDHHGGVATGVEGVNTSVLPLSFPRAFSRARERRVRGKSAPRGSLVSHALWTSYSYGSMRPSMDLRCLCAPLERGVNDSATRECYIPAACRRRDARERCEDFAVDSCRSQGNLSITLFAGNMIFKYLSLVRKLWKIYVHFEKSRRI